MTTGSHDLPNTANMTPQQLWEHNSDGDPYAETPEKLAHNSATDNANDTATERGFKDFSPEWFRVYADSFESMLEVFEREAEHAAAAAAAADVDDVEPVHAMRGHDRVFCVAAGGEHRLSRLPAAGRPGFLVDVCNACDCIVGEPFETPVTAPDLRGSLDHAAVAAQDRATVATRVRSDREIAEAHRELARAVELAVMRERVVELARGLRAANLELSFRHEREAVARLGLGLAVAFRKSYGTVWIEVSPPRNPATALPGSVESARRYLDTWELGTDVAGALNPPADA